MKDVSFRLDIRRKFFTVKKSIPVRLVRHWKRLPKEAVDVPSLQLFKGQVEWDSEQPDVVKDAPAHGREVRLDDLY